MRVSYSWSGQVIEHPGMPLDVIIGDSVCGQLQPDGDKWVFTTSDAHQTLYFPNQTAAFFWIHKYREGIYNGVDLYKMEERERKERARETSRKTSVQVYTNF